MVSSTCIVLYIEEMEFNYSCSITFMPTVHTSNGLSFPPSVGHTYLRSSSSNECLLLSLIINRTHVSGYTEEATG